MSDNRLPKPRNGTRCAALDMNGRQCRNLAIRQENYRCDPEVYSYSGKLPMWVRVGLCAKHADD